MPRYHRPTLDGEAERVTVNLETTMRLALDRVAAEDSKPRSEVIREAVREYLENRLPKGA